MQPGRMYLFAPHMKLQIITALMTGHNLHLGWLAHNHSISLGVVFQQAPRYIRRAKQPDLLIARKGKLQRALEVQRGCFHHRLHRQGYKALHIAGAAAIEAALFFDHLPRICAPVLAFHGHNIGMAREGHAASHVRPDLCHQPGFAAVLIGIDHAVDSVLREIVPHKVNERQIRVRTDRWERDQMVQQLAGAQYICHASNWTCIFAQVKRHLAHCAMCLRIRRRAR